MKTAKASPAETFALAIERAAGYDLLARCFAYPDEAAVDAMRASAAATGHLLANGPLDPLLRALASSGHEQMERGYAECFTLTTSPDCPTFETAYLCNDPSQQTARMAALNGFYRAFGADTAGGFRPDDVSVELEFMSFLCRKQAYAIERMGAPRVRQATRAQRMFLTEHLGRWAQALGQRTAAMAQPGRFHAILGNALDAWLERETEILGAGRIERVEGPQMPWPDRAERGGTSGGPALVAGFEALQAMEVVT